MDNSSVSAFAALAIIIAAIVFSHMAVKSRSKKLVDQFEIIDPSVKLEHFTTERKQ